MNHFILTVLVGAFAVIVFDTIGSFASRSFGFPYYWLTIGSFFIYFSVGFIAAKYNRLMFAPLAAGITSLVDSTLGWYISWVIGPGRPTTEIDTNVIIASIAFVTFTGVFVGFIGGFVNRISTN